MITLDLSRQATPIEENPKREGERTGFRPSWATGHYQRGSRNPRPPDPLSFCLRYSA